jgi:hypothetical protein
MGIGTQNGVEPPPAPGKNRWRTEKMSCKTMKQNENEQNYKKTVHAGRGRETKWEIPGKGHGALPIGVLPAAEWSNRNGRRAAQRMRVVIANHQAPIFKTARTVFGFDATKGM